jgi:cell division protein FtsA
MRIEGPHRQKRGKTVAVLDIGTSKVCCVIARRLPGGRWQSEIGEPPQFQALGFGHRASEGIRSGVIVDMDGAERAIRAAVDQAERQAGVTIDDVWLAVTAGRLRSDVFTASAVLKTGAVRRDDIDRVMGEGRKYAGRDKARVLHVIPTGYRLDDAPGIAEPVGMLGEKLSVDIHAIVADDAPMRNLAFCVERCHLRPVRIVAAPYASALASITPDEAKLGVACIEMGAGATTVSVFSEGVCVFVDAIAIGGHHITVDIARALSTPIDRAERMKTLHGSAFASPSDEREIITYPAIGDEARHAFSQITKSQLAVLMRPRIEQILDVVRQRLATSGFAALAGQRVVLTGGASLLTGLSEFTSHMLGKSVRIAEPRTLRGLAENAAEPSFATAIGLLIATDSPEWRGSGATTSRHGGAEAGYLSRMGRWIKESF